MTEVLTPLTEIIAAYQVGTDKAARFGAQHFTIPIFPPAFKLVTNFTPLPGTHCSVVFWITWSPAVLPNVFYLELTHRGIVFQSGTITAINLVRGYNIWIEVTQKDIAVARITNLSPINQFFDASLFSLTVQTPDDLKRINDIVHSFASHGSVL